MNTIRITRIIHNLLLEMKDEGLLTNDKVNNIMNLINKEVLDENI